MKVLDKASQEREITNIDEIVGNFMDEDIYYDCLKYIYNHNQQYYQRLEEEYLQVNQNSQSEYINLFAKNNIDFKTLPKGTQKLLLEKSLEELELKLQFINKFNLHQEQMIFICINSKLETIKIIESYLLNGYITSNFIKKHFEILYSDNLLNILIKNINTLLRKRINLKNISKEEIYLISPQLLSKNIELLNRYSVNFMSRKITNLDMLGEVNLEERLNSFIEVGLLENIKQDIQILNEDDNLAKRIVLSRSIGDEIFENGKIKSYILKKDEFYINDSKIDSYIIDRDNSKYHSDCVIIFTDEDKKEGYYEVEGIIIPSGRINNLKVSLNDIIVPSLYSKEEVKILEKHKK